MRVAQALALGCLVALAGCVQRIALTDELLADLDHPHHLRMYPSQRLVIRYRTTKVALTRKTDGAIVEEDNIAGAHVLIVTFDRHCERRECAYAFREDADGRYRFASAPPRGALLATPPDRRSSDVFLEVKRRSPPFREHRIWGTVPP